MNVGTNIAKFRKAKKLTQEELAKLINVSPKTISSYETNRNLPNIEMLILLSQALDVKIDDILALTKENSIEIKKKYEKKNLIKVVVLFLVSLFILLYFILNEYTIVASLMAKSYLVGTLSYEDFKTAEFLIFVDSIEYILVMLVAIFLYWLGKERKHKIMLVVAIILLLIVVASIITTGINYIYSDVLACLVMGLASLVISLKNLIKK